MRVSGFRVEKFRSVVDSEWCSLSPDGVTALVGQNESGKTSLLRAVYSFQRNEIDEDDLRAGEEPPIIHVSYELGDSRARVLTGLELVLPEGVDEYVEAHGNRVSLQRRFVVDDDGAVGSVLELDDAGLAEVFQSTTEQDDEADEGERPYCTAAEFAEELFREAPEVTLFIDDESLLPSRIDVSSLTDEDSTDFGRRGALNYLDVAGLDLAKLTAAGARTRKKLLTEANTSVTQRFREFWTQTIGGASQVEFECELKSHEAGEPRPGEQFLEFWVKDASDMLYPGQRSKGITWFMSFFLALATMARNAGSPALMLVDEPGVSLHAQAQQGVLVLLETLSSNMQIVYSTHSPYLVDCERLYRVLAVLRVPSNGYAETRVLSAHRLGSADRDTMFPVLTAMGMDLSGQNVVQKKGNVLVEEISAVYYLKAFSLLCGSKKRAYFLAVTGVDNIPVYANLLTGWGLSFGAAIDADVAGKRVKRKLQESLYLGDVKETNQHVVLLPSGEGIEDAFTKEDFRSLVLQDPACVIEGSNSSHMKGRAKGIAAAAFFKRVESGVVHLGDLAPETQSVVRRTIQAVEGLL